MPAADIDVQCFTSDGTWINPGTGQVECYLRAGDGAGGDGEQVTARFDATDLPARVPVTIGQAGRGCGYPRDDGYALIVTSRV